MMRGVPIDEASLDSGTPRTDDGRTYPEHLRPYETYDRSVLAAARNFAGPFTFDELAAAVSGQDRLRDVLPRWLAPAGWRLLVARDESGAHSPRAYVVTERGEERLTELDRDAAA
jgi:hypothetical protein